MNTQEMNKKIREGMTDGNVHKSLEKPLAKLRALSRAKGSSHDVTTGNTVRHRALEGARRIGITEHRPDGGRNHLAPGSGLRTAEARDATERKGGQSEHNRKRDEAIRNSLK